MYQVIKCAISVLNIQITYLGYTFTLWQVMFYSILATIVLYVILRIFR